MARREKRERKKWESPKLIRYGKVTQLTTDLSGPDPDPSGGFKE